MSAEDEVRRELSQGGAEDVSEIPPHIAAVIDAAVLAGSERAVRLATAAGLRTQATALRTVGDTMIGTAREYDRWADGIERGKAPVPIEGVRYRLIAENLAPRGERDERDEEEDEPAPLEKIFRQPLPSQGGYIYAGEGGAALSPAMHAWLDTFDPRTLGLDTFAETVNATVDAGGAQCVVDVARWVHERAHELADQRNRRAFGG